jgi:hypothetical protein
MQGSGHGAKVRRSAEVILTLVNIQHDMAKTEVKKRTSVAKGKKEVKEGRTPSAKKATTRDLEDWRDGTLDRMRSLILAADPKMVEEQKWKKPSNGMTGIPVWSHDGLVCTGETYKDKVKLTFAQGVALPDPAGLFNAADNGKVRRAIDIREGHKVDEKAFKTLVKAAVALNQAGKKK